MDDDKAYPKRQIDEVKDQFKAFGKAYEDLDKATREMRTGRDQRVNKDLDSRKTLVELQHEVSKLKKDAKENQTAWKQEISHTADTIRLEMCKFIENIKSLIEKLADKFKRMEHTVQYL